MDEKMKQSTEEGYFVGPTIFDHVTQEMKIWQDEIFAPVLSIVRVKDLDEAIEVANDSRFANGACIYTDSGGSVRKFREKIDAGMLRSQYRGTCTNGILPILWLERFVLW